MKQYAVFRLSRALAAAALVVACLWVLRPAVEAQSTATLTIIKATDPAGGAGFPFTIDPAAATFAGQWGGPGAGQSQFAAPQYVAIDDAGNVYVSDGANHRVQKFDAAGNFVRMWGKDVVAGGGAGHEVCLPLDPCQTGAIGNGDGELNSPAGIALDAAGNVYVVDAGNHRVQVFDANGAYLRQWGRSGGGVGGAGGEFHEPDGIAIDGAGHVFVADTANRRIQKFTSQGVFVRAWGFDVLVGDGMGFEFCGPLDTCKAGIAGSNKAQLAAPAGVALDAAGNVYVVDNFNHRVQTYDSDGNYLNTFGFNVVIGGGTGFEVCTAAPADLCQKGSVGNGNGQFNFARGIAVDRAGSIYVADTNNHRVQKFSGAPAYLGHWGGNGGGDGQLNGPTAVALRGLDVLVVDAGNHRVQRFTQTGATLDDGQSAPFVLAPGTYLVSELLPPGWDVPTIACDGGSPVVSGATVSVTLAADAAVACTFTNAPPDTTPPETTLDDGPTGATSNHDASFTFSSDDPTAAFQCDLDNGGWATCASPHDYTNLADAAHSFAVRACDPAGNCDPSPASRAWTIDTTLPTVSFTTAPPDPSGDATPDFAFSGSDGGAGIDPAGFECSLDGGAWAACASPVTLDPLPDGDHAFSVRVHDLAGNQSDATTHTWTVDATLPTVTITAAPAALSNDATPSFEFTGDDGSGSGINPAGYECKLDAGAYAACTSPKTYPTQGDGPHTFSVRARDMAGNVSNPDDHAWSVDATPPTTSIIAQPPALTTATAASYTVTSNDPSASFFCKLDAAAYAPCASPQNYTGLGDGQHTFSVYAVDAAGNADATPASWTWRVDTTAPETSITGQPSNPSASANASFTFSGSDAGGSGVAGFECRLDGGPWAACNSGAASYTGLSNAAHTFEARTGDAAGNVDATQASYTWTVDVPPDTTPPDTTLTGAPANPTAGNDPVFTFTSNEPGSAFRCALDGEADAPCASGQTYSNVPDGVHAFAVYAVDPAGNPDPEPATHTWRIDTTGPATTITAAPPDPSDTAAATFTFSGDDGGGSGVTGFQCRLDGGAWGACNGGTKSYSGLADGSHTFEVQATDAVGNTGAPAGYTWFIDAPTPPSAVVYVSGAGGTVTGGPTYQKNDILKWQGGVWSVWFDGAGKTAGKADINAFDIDDDGDGSAWIVLRPADLSLPGLATRTKPHDIFYWDGAAWSLFFDGSDVSLTTSGETIKSVEVLPGSASPVGAACLYYLLISANTGGAVTNSAPPAVRFTGDDVLGFCMTGQGANTTGVWHLAFEGQSQGMLKNSIGGVSASADGSTLYFTVSKGFTGDNGRVNASQVVGFSGGVFSAPLWTASAHGFLQQVDSIDYLPPP